MMEEKVYLFKNFRPETSLFQCLDMLLLALDFTSQKHDAVSYITTKTHQQQKNSFHDEQPKFLHHFCSKKSSSSGKP
jgi:uncharacterized protein (UPF0332 family)